MNLKPCYVYKVKQGDFSACMVCYNMEKIISALVKKISNNNEFASTQCDNYDMYEMDDVCICNECIQHQATIIALKKSPLKLFQHLCCNNNYKYPNLDCIESNCKNNIDCGASKLD